LLARKLVFHFGYSFQGSNVEGRHYYRPAIRVSRCTVPVLHSNVSVRKDRCIHETFRR
jgi:hypothetical protein